MTRSITFNFRRSAESSFADDANLCFLTISHPVLLNPIRVVGDTVDYVYNGNTFIGFTFKIQILSDDEQPPRAKLSIQNIDPRIGDVVRGLTSPPRLKMEILSSMDFNLLTNPRVALVPSPAPNVAYVADRLFLTNVNVDIVTVSGDIVGWDYLQRVWPGRRARQDLFPALFR